MSLIAKAVLWVLCITGFLFGLVLTAFIPPVGLVLVGLFIFFGYKLAKGRKTPAAATAAPVERIGVYYKWSVEVADGDETASFEKIRPGDEVELMAGTDAVSIFSRDGQRMGALPGDISQKVRPLMDSAEIEAFIERMHAAGKPGFTVELRGYGDEETFAGGNWLRMRREVVAGDASGKIYESCEGRVRKTGS